jgi:hypothetical protein
MCFELKLNFKLLRKSNTKIRNHLITDFKNKQEKKRKKLGILYDNNPGPKA